MAYLFDEDEGLLRERSANVGLEIEPHLESGRLVLQQIDAAELSPGEFAHAVVERVARDEARLVIIDSLNGYYAAMPEERFLVLHMHELLSYLNRQGTVTLLTMAQHGLIGDMRTPADLTYLSDSVLLLRYFEASGRVRRAISAIKKRAGPHEDAIREFRWTREGLEVGAPLTGFQGVLRGIPNYVGQSGPLLGGAAQQP